MMSVVTGGAGYIGSNLVAALLADGHTVRVVDLREPVTAARLGATWIRADVRDPGAMRAAIDGAEIVYHLAAVISIVGGLGGLVHSVNVDGVSVVADASLAAGCRRMVHCSSIHAFDLSACVGRTVDESSPRSTNVRLPAYDRSKAAGEAELRRIIDRGLDALSVNPTAVIGPIDESPSRMGAVLLALWRRRLPAVVAGGFDWVDVRDVVGALRAAADHGRRGESYLVAGHRLGLPALARMAATCSGTPVTRLVAPRWLVWASSPLATALARRTGSSLLATREALLALDAFPHVDTGKAAIELGHQPRPIADTLGALHSYFVDAGRLTPGR